MFSRNSDKDEQFIEELYANHSDDVFNLCASYMRNTQDAEDCMQEVFLRALKNVRKLHSHLEPLKWLFRTARLVCLEKFREKSHRAENEASLGDFVESLYGGTLEDDLLASEYTEEQILFLRRSILERLSEKERELYVLRYIDKLDVGKISERLNITYSNATTRLSRLKKKLLALVYKAIREQDKGEGNNG